MKKVKNKSFSQFKRMSKERQLKEIGSMTKRANVRMKLLEDNKIHNGILEQTKEILTNMGRTNGKFYEGKKYKDEQELFNVFNLVNNFLKNAQSTLTGVKEKIQKEFKDYKNITPDKINKLSDKELSYISQKESKKADRNLNKLEKAGFTKYANSQAEYMNKSEGQDKNRFYTGTKFMDRNEMLIHIRNVMKFNSMKSSTIKGYKEMENEKINILRSKGLDITKEVTPDFLQFISSGEYKEFKKRMDSEQLMEDFIEARKKGVEVPEIMTAFQDYQNNKLTYDKVQERIKTAKFLK